MDLPPPTRPDLIEEFERLGVTQYAFGKKWNIAPNFVSALRQGRYKSQVAAVGVVAQFEKALKKEAAEQASGSEAGALPPKHNTGQSHRPADPENTAGLEELGKACETARTAKELSEIGARLSGMAARKEIDIPLMRAIHENISRREQLLADERLEAEQARAGEEIVVRVTYLNGWTGGPLPE